jgi:hypothetical protein
MYFIKYIYFLKNFAAFLENKVFFFLFRIGRNNNNNQKKGNKAKENKFYFNNSMKNLF